MIALSLKSLMAKVYCKRWQSIHNLYTMGMVLCCCIDFLLATFLGVSKRYTSYIHQIWFPACFSCRAAILSVLDLATKQGSFS